MTATNAPRRWSLQNRIRAFQAVTATVFALLLLSFGEIQVANTEYYRERAELNRVKVLPVTAPRGNILDRHGRVLAQSRFSLSALIDPAMTVPQHVPGIAQGLMLDVDRLRQRLINARDFGGAQNIVLKDNLSAADLSFLQAHRSELPEIDLVDGMRRQYPASAVAVHALGYVGEISESELNLREYLFHSFGSQIGKSGIERQYDRWLTGENGSLRFLVDTTGRELATVGFRESIPGNNLHLTIDLELQTVAELGLEGRKGAVVALDPRNGEILLMASSPVFDPNKFVTGFTSEEWLALNADPQTPLLNRAIQGTFAMGSVFKPIHGLAGLEAGVAGPDFRVNCPGGLSFGGHYFRCHKRGGHGTVDLRRAIAVSCDVYFYRLGHELGIDTLSRYARRAGLGALTHVDLPDEVPGLVPSVAWKVRQTLQPWHPGETIVVSIGQGAMSVTPIQAAHAIAGLAMGGVWHRPHLVSHQQRALMDPQSRPPPPRTASIAAEDQELLRQAMWDVVNNGGTGRQARLAGVDVCGKTGTSQRVSNELRLKAKREDFEDDAWFVGFAPCKNPEIVVAALLENGKHSYYAAALVRDVMQTWLATRELNFPPDTDRTLALSLDGGARP